MLISIETHITCDFPLGGGGGVRTPYPPSGSALVAYQSVIFLAIPNLDVALSIVRPVKRDWAVLSKDTPVDIFILKSVRQSVFIHL